MWRSSDIPNRIEVRIVEAYNDYDPPFDVAKVVLNLLSSVPDMYLRGLECVVLRNESALSRKERLGKARSRKRKFDKSLVCGFYHHRWQGKPPWIEIRVDKTIGAWRGLRYFWFRPFRELCIGEVLYHELGHHIHECLRPQHREKEDVAEIWAQKFLGSFFWRRYWYALWPLKVFAMSKSLLKGMKGSTSRSAKSG